MNIRAPDSRPSAPPQTRVTQRSYQCISDVLGRNRISVGKKSDLPELSLTGLNATADAATSLLCAERARCLTAEPGQFHAAAELATSCLCHETHI
ncbi:hypothetical protein EVAR_34683_1 [Eumeta japonica]|uniref:Uncharacterized protein n=1 Tax=Eumeta variegata TaxID=151549 RepID=A0A4C1VFL2_EUMVA|nr:hypothetical protein EVAR_34683_1 [Eumeta japonica]